MIICQQEEWLHLEDIHLPIDGVLDLHTFRPQDAASVVEDYLTACLDRGIYEVKIIHGKGKGMLQRTVHALLEKNPVVMRFGLDTGPSGWGATIVILKSDALRRLAKGPPIGID